MIGFSVRESSNSIGLSLSEWTPTLKVKLALRIAALSAELLARVQAGEPRRTGRLRTLTRRFVDVRETFVRGRVRVLGPGGRGHNIAAAALEYGAHKSFEVKGYKRGGRHSPGRVSTYRRHANIPERRFLRGPALAMRARILAELQLVIDETNAEMTAKAQKAKSL